MLGTDKFASSTTQPMAPASGGFFNTIRNDFKALGDKISAPYNAMTDDQKKRYDRFNQMAMSQPQQAQFSPVQFGGAANGASLAALVEELKKRGI